jgi:hypothetical protein
MKPHVAHRLATYYQAKKSEYPFEVRVTTFERPEDFSAAHPNVMFARVPMADRTVMWMFPSRDARATFERWKQSRGG